MVVAHQPVIQIIKDPEALSTKGSEDCVHAPRECQRDSEREDHRLVGSSPRLELKEAPMLSPDWYLEVGVFEVDCGKPVALIYGLEYPWDCEHPAPKGSQMLVQASYVQDWTKASFPFGDQKIV